MRLAPLALACAGCNALLGLEPTSERADGDAALAGDGATPGRDADDGAWSDPEQIPALATLADEDDPAMSPDRFEIYAAVSAGGGAKDIVRGVRNDDDDPFVAVTTANDLYSGLTDATPRIAADSHSIWIASNRYGDLDILHGTREDTMPGTPWNNVGALPAPINAVGADEHGFTPCAASTRFVFASTRVGPDHDVYELVNGSAVEAIATAGEELSPFVTADCLTLYFAADYAGTQDLYVATRGDVGEPFANLTRLDELSTDTADEQDPWLTADGTRILFASDRAGTWDVWEATR